MKRLIRGLASPCHDRALEAAMTSVFIYGPVGSALAFAIGVLLPR